MAQQCSSCGKEMKVICAHYVLRYWVEITYECADCGTASTTLPSYVYWYPGRKQGEEED